MKQNASRRDDEKSKAKTTSVRRNLMHSMGNIENTVNVESSSHHSSIRKQYSPEFTGNKDRNRRYSNQSLASFRLGPTLYEEEYSRNVEEEIVEENESSDSEDENVQWDDPEFLILVKQHGCNANG
jgi:hypothetical protein